MRQKNIQIILQILTLSCLLYSCNTADKKLDRVYSLLESNPDSAFSILNTLHQEELSPLLQARFSILMTRAREKQGLDIRHDTAVFEARDYLLVLDDPYAGVACFVSASVYDRQNKTPAAIYDYLMATDLIKGNDELQGYLCYNLARTYYDQSLYSDALPYIRKARIYEDHAKVKDEYNIYTLEYLALIHLSLPSGADSALLYFKRALSLRPQDNETKKRIFQNMAVAYYKVKEYHAALGKCREASAFPKVDSINEGRLSLVFANTYYHMGQKDSAYLYACKARRILEKSPRALDKADLYDLLYHVEQDNGQYERAYYYRLLYEAHAGFHGHVSEEVVKAQNKYYGYKAEKSRMEKRHMVIQRRLYVIIIGCLVLMLSGGIWFFIRFRKMKEAEKEVERLRLQAEIRSIKKAGKNNVLKLAFCMDEIGKLDNMVSSVDYDTAKEVRRQMKKVVKNQGWDEMYPILNDVYEGLLDRILTDFPMLSEKEYRICCLLFCGLGIFGASAVTGEKENTTRNKQTNIRKKLKLGDGGDIRKYLYRYYGLNDDPEEDGPTSPELKKT